MDKRACPTIEIKTKPDYFLFWVMVLMSVVGLCVILAYVQSLWSKLLLSMLLLVYSTFILLRDILHRLPCSWKIMRVNQKGEVTLQNRQGRMFLLVPSQDTFISPYLTILNWQKSWWQWNLPPLVLLDLNRCAEHRKLRVWLRWGRPQEGKADDPLPDA